MNIKLLLVFAITGILQYTAHLLEHKWKFSCDTYLKVELLDICIFNFTSSVRLHLFQFILSLADFECSVPTLLESH